MRRPGCWGGVERGGGEAAAGLPQLPDLPPVRDGGGGAGRFSRRRPPSPSAGPGPPGGREVALAPPRPPGHGAVVRGGRRRRPLGPAGAGKGGVRRCRRALRAAGPAPGPQKVSGRISPGGSWRELSRAVPSSPLLTGVRRARESASREGRVPDPGEERWGNRGSTSCGTGSSSLGAACLSKAFNLPQELPACEE